MPGDGEESSSPAQEAQANSPAPAVDDAVSMLHQDVPNRIEMHTRLKSGKVASMSRYDHSTDCSFLYFSTG